MTERSSSQARAARSPGDEPVTAAQVLAAIQQTGLTLQDALRAVIGQLSLETNQPEPSA